MSSMTGENEVNLNRIIGGVRAASIFFLLLHFYFSGIDRPGIYHGVIGAVTEAIAQLPVIGEPVGEKVLAFLLLVVSLFGARGKKAPGFTLRMGVLLGLAGTGLYFGSWMVGGMEILYVAICSGGWLVVLYAGSYLSRVMLNRPGEDVFNRLHESFPQEERLLRNSRSVNLPARYLYNGKERDSWLNFLSPQRGTLVLGNPGSGKTIALQHFIRQGIQHGNAMVLHDFKYDDLSKLAYNCFLRYRDRYPKQAGFYVLHFGDPRHSHRCNLIHPSTLGSIFDAEEAARAILFGLNMDWISKRGEYFVESAISFVKALIWYLRRYENGAFCTLAHVIELAQTPVKVLFTILGTEPELLNIIGPFIEGIMQEAKEQLAGQITSATLGLGKLSSPDGYYILTGNDFTLDVNSLEAPKIVCIGNDPQRSDAYGPFISGYLNAISRIANRKGSRPLDLIFEEFSTIAVHTVNRTIATGRSNNIAVTLCLQNIDQMKETYGEKFAAAVVNGCGNVISGQVTGDSARMLADRFGRSLQQRQSLTTTYSDVQVMDSQALEPMIPESRIASLSPGEFVGMVADTPDEPVDLKSFCCRISVDFEAMDHEAKEFKPLPVVHAVSDEEILANFQQVRAEIKGLVALEKERLMKSPGLYNLIV